VRLPTAEIWKGWWCGKSRDGSDARLADRRPVAGSNPRTGQTAFRPIEIAHHRAGTTRIGLPRPPGISSRARISPSPAIGPTWTPWTNPDAKIIPVALVAKPRAHRESDPKRDERAGISDRRFINDGGIVHRHVNDIRLGGYDPNIVTFRNDLLLRRVDQGTGRPRLNPELLNGLHDIGRLLRKRRAQCLGPVEIAVHPFHHIG